MSDLTAYRELPVTGVLSPYLVCGWTSAVAASETPQDRRILPDACIDIIWMDGRLFVAGPDTIATRATLRPGTLVAGVRFRPGLGPTMLGLPATELRDRRVDLAALWGDREASEVAGRLSETASADGGVEVLERALVARLRRARPRDLLVEALVRAVQRQAVAGLDGAADSLGAVGTRQLRRRTIAAVGYGPRMLARVLRLQRAVSFGADRRLGLADVAAASGYADQAHMTRECRELAATTPAVLLGRRGPPAAV